MSVRASVRNVWSENEEDFNLDLINISVNVSYSNSLSTLTSVLKFGSSHPCCHDSKSKGCTRGRHRDEHHNDYPYEQKIILYSSMVYYTDQREFFFEVRERERKICDI